MMTILWAPKHDMVGTHNPLRTTTDVAVMRLTDLKAWLKAKRVTVSQMATADAAAHHNALIGELLQEIEDAEKEGSR